jgi:hypothetical protein
VAVLKSKMLDDTEKWYEQSRALLLDESLQRCARGGKSFNEADWRCEHRPDATLVKVCEDYFSQSQCAAMSRDFANRDS